MKERYEYFEELRDLAVSRAHQIYEKDALDSVVMRIDYELSGLGNKYIAPSLLYAQKVLSDAAGVHNGLLLCGAGGELTASVSAYLLGFIMFDPLDYAHIGLNFDPYFYMDTRRGPEEVKLHLGKRAISVIKNRFADMENYHIRIHESPYLTLLEEVTENETGAEMESISSIDIDDVDLINLARMTGYMYTDGNIECLTANKPCCTEELLEMIRLSAFGGDDRLRLRRTGIAKAAASSASMLTDRQLIALNHYGLNDWQKQFISNISSMNYWGECIQTSLWILKLTNYLQI